MLNCLSKTARLTYTAMVPGWFLQKLIGRHAPLKSCKLTLNSSDGYVFRGLTFYKKSRSYRLRKANKPLSYSTARSTVLDAFESIGLPKSKFGLHSLRAGGASAAVNSGVHDRLFKRHGRWFSDRAKDGYIKDSIMPLPSMTQKLGI